MSLQNRIDLLAEEFAKLESWEERYKKIIALGKELPDLPDADKVDKNKVKGCQSQVWLTAKLDEKREVVFSADSDALIVRGLVSVLLRIYSQAKPEEILNTSPDFLEKLGFKSNLSPSRTNGLYAMVKQIQYYALAFKTLLSRS